MRELSESDTDPKRHSIKTPVVTAFLFESYLSCPTKCFLLATGVAQFVNAYASWASERSRSYQDAGIKNLAARYDSTEITCDAPFDASSASRKSGLAINALARVQKLETIFHAIEWAAEKRDGKLENSLTPIRFIPDNKLSRTDKLLLAFDAHVLSKLWNRPVASGRIVHGDDFVAHKVKTSEAEREVKKIIGKITALLSNSDPPKLALNRHCAECVFQERCRKLAVEKDDLSLLPGLPDKEKVKLNSKGIFSVTQLSYTFCPRRRSKRHLDRPEKYHHALKALAIREKKIHVVGTPQLKIEGTPVFLDVEGLPDQDFYYLVGLRWQTANGVEQRSLWANTPEDEAKLWKDFCAVLSSIASPTLIHYGSFETTFFKRMRDRYGVPSEGSVAAGAIASAINLLSVIFAQIYFPTYSNGLKDIAGCIGFKWNDPAASGLQSIVWRHKWERTHDAALKDKLIHYNADDCEALQIVANRVVELYGPAPADSLSLQHVVHTSNMKRESPFGFKRVNFVLPELSAINDAAYWDYQRERVYVKSGYKSIPKKNKRKHSTTRVVMKPNATIGCSRLHLCPNCKSRKIYSHGKISKTVMNLRFMRYGIKRWVVRYVAHRFKCTSCNGTFNPSDPRWPIKKYGSDLIAYAIYLNIELRIPQEHVSSNLNKLFGLGLGLGITHGFKASVAQDYRDTYDNIMNRPPPSLTPSPSRWSST